MTTRTATADCELRDGWQLEQDVNAWSSLAYVAAGLVLAQEVRRSRLPRAVYGLAAVMAAEGFGSLLYQKEKPRDPFQNQCPKRPTRFRSGHMFPEQMQRN